MKIYLLDSAVPGEFASFSHVGTWSTGGLCDSCQQPTSQLVEPLTIEWEPGSTLIGDFSWCGFCAVVKTSIGESLNRMGLDCHLGQVLVVEPQSKRKDVVAFPYEGPSLSWLTPKRRVKIDVGKSGVELLIDCHQCKQKKYTFKTQELHINSNDWSRERIFQIAQFYRSDALFATEEGVEIIDKLGCSNIVATAAGQIV